MAEPGRRGPTKSQVIAARRTLLALYEVDPSIYQMTQADLDEISSVRRMLEHFAAATGKDLWR